MLKLTSKNGKGIEVLNITHANCMDGTYSAVVVKDWCRLNGYAYNVHFAQYGSDVDKLPNLEGKHVIITDFSFSLDVMKVIEEKAEGVVMIDHHASVDDEVKELPYMTFNNNECGATLTWKVLMGGDVEAPTILDYIKDRDLWQWELTNSKEVSGGLRLYTVEELLGNPIALQERFLNTVKHDGVIVDKYEEQALDRKVRGVLKHPNLFKVFGKFTYCVNNTYLLSEVGNELAQASSNAFSVQWFVTEKDVVFSFRSIGDMDVSEICKQLGGGGHKNAAGCSIPIKLMNWHRFLNDKILDVMVNRSMT